MNRNIVYFSGPSLCFYSLTQTSPLVWKSVSSSGKFEYEITLSPDRIVILKFAFYGETKTGAENTILNHSDMKANTEIYMNI